MRQDEFDFLRGATVSIHQKRIQFLRQKWSRRGWCVVDHLSFNGWSWTEAGERELEIIRRSQNDRDWWQMLDHQVSIIQLVNEPPRAGIFIDCGDNGFHFYTSRTVKGWYSYFLGYGTYRLNGVVSIRPHPDPMKIFNRLNYLAWKYSSNSRYRHEDAFHLKWDRYLMWGGQRPESDSHPCHPSCQCRFGESVKATNDCY